MKFIRFVIAAIRHRSISSARWVMQYEQHETK